MIIRFKGNFTPGQSDGFFAIAIMTKMGRTIRCLSGSRSGRQRSHGMSKEAGGKE
jgi:hypothetical protein